MSPSQGCRRVKPILSYERNEGKFLETTLARFRPGSLFKKSAKNTPKRDNSTNFRERRYPGAKMEMFLWLSLSSTLQTKWN